MNEQKAGITCGRVKKWTSSEMSRASWSNNILKQPFQNVVFPKITIFLCELPLGLPLNQRNFFRRHFIQSVWWKSDSSERSAFQPIRKQKNTREEHLSHVIEGNLYPNIHSKNVSWGIKYPQICITIKRVNIVDNDTKRNAQNFFGHRKSLCSHKFEIN